MTFSCRPIEQNGEWGWIADMKAELAKPNAPDLVSLLNAYYTSHKAGAYSPRKVKSAA